MYNNQVSEIRTHEYYYVYNNQVSETRIHEYYNVYNNQVSETRTHEYYYVYNNQENIEDYKGIIRSLKSSTKQYSCHVCTYMCIE